MRYIAFALAVLGFTLTADAQERQRERRDPPARASQPPPAEAAPRPPYVVPRPSPPQGMRQSPYPPSARPWPPYRGYLGSGYGYPYMVEEYEERRRYPENVEMTTTGVVQLEITPSTALEYYVDGIFMGTSSQLGTQIEMTAGGRRIEVRRGGYKPITFDMRVAEGSVTVFRGTLEPLAEVPDVPPPAIGGRTLYVIPGCYFGNVRPQQAHLRKGCDLAAMKVRTPPQ